MPLQKTLEQGVAKMGDVRNKDGSSVPGLSDQRPQSGAFSVATGSIPVEASEIIQVAEYLEERAAKLKTKSKLLYKTADILDGRF